MNELISEHTEKYTNGFGTHALLRQMSVIPLEKVSFYFFAHSFLHVALKLPNSALCYLCRNRSLKKNNEAILY